MKPNGERQNMKKFIREFLKSLKALMQPEPYDLTFEEFVRLESKKTRIPSHWGY
jgi:hypothetical protein